ncbi:MAG: hypothetical protein JWQ79_2868 [Mucilaginibacter sp.]|nr:hypothetical protein [Mucilaginibacter sp.]
MSYSDKTNTMGKLFEKENNSGLIAALIIGGVAAAALSYLFLTEDGEEILAGLKHKVKDMAKDLGAEIVSGKTGISKKSVKKAVAVVVE